MGYAKNSFFFVLLLAFFFHCTTVVTELKIIWGTLDSFWKVCKNTSKVPGWASAHGLPLHMLFWKISVIAQSETASPKQWVRHVLKCVSLVELSVFWSYHYLLGLPFLSVLVSLTINHVILTLFHLLPYLNSGIPSHVSMPKSLDECLLLIWCYLMLGLEMVREISELVPQVCISSF